MSGGDSAALIEALKRPEAYPHAVGEIQVVETHISWVLLTGEYAYKIKKPVDLGFVDFSTLGRRRFCCEEELRLNGRLAPVLYLQVLPIGGTREAPRVGGSGEPLEYCVQMRQFDQSCLLSELIAAERLKPEHIDSLARQVAEFHASIPAVEPASRFGTPEAVAEPIFGNFVELERVPDARDRNLVEKLRQWSLEELARLGDVLAARKRDGCVRECHGDMHLGNMILEGDAVTVFDCIEFNEDLRWIDVMSEIAFCAMDLEDRGRPDYARRFLNRVLELSGDYGGLAVFRLYVAYRAAVRAKVQFFRQTQLEENSPEFEATGEAVRRYLEIAASATEAPLKSLAILHGYSGSGKTWASQQLLEAAGAIRLRSDVERKRLAGIKSGVRTKSEVGGGIYSASFSERTYAKLAELAEKVLAAGFSVIVDATFLKRAERQRFRALAEKWQVPFVILDVVADEATCRRRIEARGAVGSDASEATIAVLDQQLKNSEPLDVEERPFAIEIDTEQAGWLERTIEAWERRQQRSG